MILVKGGDIMYHLKNYIPVRVKNGDWFPNQAIVVYALINMYTYGHDGLFSYNISTDCIGMELFNATVLTDKQKKSIKDGFDELAAYYPDALEPINNKETIWKIDVKSFLTITKLF